MDTVLMCTRDIRTRPGHFIHLINSGVCTCISHTCVYYAVRVWIIRIDTDTYPVKTTARHKAARAPPRTIAAKLRNCCRTRDGRPREATPPLVTPTQARDIIEPLKGIGSGDFLLLSMATRTKFRCIFSFLRTNRSGDAIRNLKTDLNFL